MRRADFSVQVDRRKPPCVLDPALLLGHAPGPSLALRLASVLEPWLTRSFWQALDASELLLLHGAGDEGAVSGAALARWLSLREGTDVGGWVLRWVGDRLAESQLLDAADADVVERYEGWAEALQRRAERLGALRCDGGAWRGWDARAGACDTLALSATLEGALVLCTAPDDTVPLPVQVALELDLQVRPAEQSPPHSLFPAERDFVREALASAGLAVLAQALPPLAAVHAWIDEDADLPSRAAQALADMPADPWSHARVWWYRL